MTVNVIPTDRELLSFAADYLEQHEWERRGEYVRMLAPSDEADPDGGMVGHGLLGSARLIRTHRDDFTTSVCVVGAICAAVALHGNLDDDEDVVDMIRHLRDVAATRLPCEQQDASLPRWNDHVAKHKADVVAVLRAAAEVSR